MAWVLLHLGPCPICARLHLGPVPLGARGPGSGVLTETAEATKACVALINVGEVAEPVSAAEVWGLYPLIEYVYT